MIAYILKSPDATQSLGFITGPTQTVNGVSCLGGYLEDVSEWSNRINISGAKGAIPEPVEFSFSLIDWTGLVRRSAAILSGASQLVGWTVEAWTSSAGSTTPDSQSSLDIEVVSAVASGDSVAISCREKWVGVGATVGFGTGTNRVGLAVGAMEITVKVPEISDPVAIDYQRDSGWKRGEFPSPTATPIPAYAPTSKTGRVYSFQCAAGAGSAFYLEIIGQTCYITGSKRSEVVGSVALISDRVDVTVSQEFADLEAIEDVGIYSADRTMRPIIGGASSILGFVDRAQIVAPLGDSQLVDYVVSFAPRTLTPGGFACYTHVPAKLAYATPVRWGVNAGALVEGTDYSGSIEDVATDATTEPAFDAIAADLAPAVPSSSMVMWASINSEALTEIKDLRLKMRVILDDPSQKFDAYDFDIKDRILVKNEGASGYSPTATLGFPFSSATFPEYTTPPLTCTVNGDPSTSTLYTYERGLRGPGGYKATQRFDSIDAANESLGLVVRGGFATMAQYQCCAVRVYGISTLSYGSSYAVVMPGESLWQSPTPSDNTPYRTCLNLLEANGLGLNPDPYPLITQSYSVPASKWGMAFEQDTTILEAAKAIASEHWLTFGSGNDTGYGVNSILEPPSFTLGDRLDVVTEPVVEYDYWAGEYRRRAYISHVDEVYDASKPDYYFGGWDSDDSPEGFGLALWNMCRAAYLFHGVQQSETYQFQSIRAADEVGKMWLSSRNGVARMRWLALQSRYITVKHPSSNPTAWAGNAMNFPADSAALAGYDLAEYAGTPLVITETSWDPITNIVTSELALPPVVDTYTGTRIVQTLGATDRITQTLSATTRYIQEL